MTHAPVKRVKGIETVSKWSARFTDAKNENGSVRTIWATE